MEEPEYLDEIRKQIRYTARTGSHYEFNGK
jgi:hypothetical protein